VCSPFRCWFFKEGLHNKSFKVTVCVFEVSRNSPSRCAVASPDASVFVHGLDKLWYPRCIHVVFNGDQDRANDIRYCRRDSRLAPVEVRLRQAPAVNPVFDPFYIYKVCELNRWPIYS
jgi:hypothetical protein